MTMGFPLPSGKVPLTQQVSCPSPIQRHIPPHQPSGATEDDGNADGATDDYDDNDDDGDDSDSAAVDDNNDIDVDNNDIDNDDIDNVNHDNLPPRVGKRNDGCHETKTRRRRRSQILWQYTQQSNRSRRGGG